MINVNGNFSETDSVLTPENRGYSYGDALFETLKVSHGKILFLEDHYFRLMSSMRIMRMEIPMHFTMEFIEQEILKTITENKLINTSAKIKIQVHRNIGGLYLPTNSEVSFIISAKAIESDFYLLKDNKYEVDLFKDFFVAPSLLSTLKTNNKALNVIASIYAKENDLDNCLLLNTDKNVVEALNGNIFLIKGSLIKTPPLKDGCLKGIMRQQLINVLELLPDYTLEEASISPFELQKADELFVTNVIKGIQPITKYRKKEYGNEVAKMLLQKINVKIRLG